jgi:hypothetical protein
MKALRLKVLRNQKYANMLFHCQLSTVNCPLLKAIETAQYEGVKAEGFKAI